MVFLSRKNGKVGELRVIVTELDRAELVCTGPRWISLNDVMNKFNHDPEITELVLNASYAGDLKDEKLTEYIQRLNNQVNAAVVEQANQKKEETKKEEEKQKVHPNGESEDDEEEDNGYEELKEFLSDYDLTCKGCGEEDKALVDAEGNIHDCEACIKIDAYQKGKKEGYEKGYEDGYAECIKHLRNISNNVQVTENKAGTTQKETNDGNTETK